VRVEDMAGRFFMDHVLIVEDQEENRNLLKMPLEANGDRVTAAGDGATSAGALCARSG
jgi:CheY-like chemotaxis protein